jgi:hypothetical protein
MTSYLIDSFRDRNEPALLGHLAEDCAFCKIIAGQAEAHKVYENDFVIAILG